MIRPFTRAQSVKPLTPLENKLVKGHQYNSIKPHPDGQPWTKCCGTKGTVESGCMCLMRKPTAGSSRYENILNGTGMYQYMDRVTIRDAAEKLIKAAAKNDRFFCCHRTTDDGYHRECAGWAAKFHKPTEKSE